MSEIPGFTDLAVIGRGAFGVVYQARQLSVGRDVAIKLLTDPSPDNDLIRRFKRESQAVGALSWHPHIAAVIDAGSTVAGQAYIVFELLPGGSLEQHIEQAPVPWTNAVSWIIQIADAVEAAHRADVLHRDIKPANVLLDRLGVAKLADFGIASMQDGTKTETGMLATTVAHAAPELFDGELASASTDVYALGSTLHTLVTGFSPFAAVGNERIGNVIARIANEPPPRPDPASVPAQVSAVIAHALAKQPQYRPRSAAAFGQALQAAQHELGQPVTTMPVSDREPATPTKPAPGQAPPAPAHEPPTSKRPFSKTIAVLSVIAVLLAAVVVGLALQRIRQQSIQVATTAGGARIAAYNALDATEMGAPLDEFNAIDDDETTYWGAQSTPETAVVATTYVIKLTEEQHVTSVGITHGESPGLGLASQIRWATTFNEADTVAVQSLPNSAGSFRIAFDRPTKQIVLLIESVHDEASMVGIAEILIEVADR